MSTLFISDLHLEDNRPQTTSLVSAFLRGPGSEAEAVYILGDLFEFWIGDDILTETAQIVANAIRELKNRRIPCYFLHGNRDFLLGLDYARRAGMELLPETLVVDLYGCPTLLLHGDTLCTDDFEYQSFRRQVRTPGFRDRFLQMSPQQRLQMAQNARDASKRHTGSSTTMDIMDVNETAVLDAFREHDVGRMIHGHTHRPAFHRHNLGASARGERLVLADWNTSGSYLCVSPKGCDMLPFTG
jgi:UDP-2,3-diacylglucosamine hydrolase